jgi:tetratricopeptide (TPR) repeat protein
LNTRREILSLAVGRRINSVSWSPDGKQLATLGDGLLEVWNVANGEEVLRLPAGNFIVVTWAPDGRRLLISGDTGSSTFLDASPGYAVPPMQPRDDDPVNRNKLARELTVAVETLRKMDRWSDAEAMLRRALTLEEGLTRQFPRSRYYRQNLGRLQRSLAERLARTNRDREAEEAYRRAIGIYQQLYTELPWMFYANGIRFSHQDLAQLYVKNKRFAEAAKEYRQAIKVTDDHWRASPEMWVTDIEKIQNDFAWLLATCPDPGVRAPAEAVKLARKAIVRNFGPFWNTLGVAQYYAGDWKASVAALDKSVTLTNGGTSFDYFFLAMAHWRLGDKEKARSWYEKAIAWMHKNRLDDEELRRFRAEAAELLGVTDQPTAR